jgi:hypothetical protein
MQGAHYTGMTEIGSETLYMLIFGANSGILQERMF